MASIRADIWTQDLLNTKQESDLTRPRRWVTFKSEEFSIERKYHSAVFVYMVVNEMQREYWRVNGKQDNGAELITERIVGFQTTTLRAQYKCERFPSWTNFLEQSPYW
jgi:hypothetical protein